MLPRIEGQFVGFFPGQLVNRLGQREGRGRGAQLAGRLFSGSRGEDGESGQRFYEAVISLKDVLLLEVVISSD